MTGLWYNGLRPPQPQSSNSASSVLIDLYEASEENGPVLHYYVIVVKKSVAERRDPNDFDIDKVTPHTATPPSLCILTAIFQVDLG